MEQPGGFCGFVRQFVGHRPIVNRWRPQSEVPAESRGVPLSKALKTHGCKVYSPIICHAFMQAVGIIDDHVIDCFRRDAGGTPSGRAATTRGRGPS